MIWVLVLFITKFSLAKHGKHCGNQSLHELHCPVVGQISPELVPSGDVKVPISQAKAVPPRVAFSWVSVEPCYVFEVEDYTPNRLSNNLKSL